MAAVTPHAILVREASFGIRLKTGIPNAVQCFASVYPLTDCYLKMQGPGMHSASFPTG
jgi:hypothetical protein